MYIDRLVIEGFKSYKDRVEVQFAPGLNVILGRVRHTHTRAHRGRADP